MTIEKTTTELTQLPGLEAPVTGALPSPEKIIELGPMKRLMLFSGRSNRPLAEDIGRQLGVELGEVSLKTFANEETYCRYGESIRGADVFIIQSGSPPVNDHLVELLIMIQAAKLASAKRITAVIPWFPYTRQDKKSKPREPITAKLVADMLEVAGVDRVLTMDLHAGQIQGFFSVPVDHMTALPLFAQYYRDKGVFGDNVVAVSPDAGRVKMARRFGQMLDGDLAIMNKTRPDARHRRGDRGDRRCPRKDRDPQRRHDPHGRDADRGRDGAAQGGGDRGLCLRDARPVLGQRIREARGERPQSDDRHRHGRHRPGQPTRERRRPACVAPARGDDHERLRRRVGLRDLRAARTSSSSRSFPGRESGMKSPMFRPSFLGLVYIVVGVAVAASYDYFKNLETFRRIASAVLAVLLWPLL